MLRQAYIIQCDQEGCEKIFVNPQKTLMQARCRAADAGWRQRQFKRVRKWFCPDHFKGGRDHIKHVVLGLNQPQSFDFSTSPVLP